MKLDEAVYGHRADGSLPGSRLRNEVASYLSAIYGNAEVEKLIAGKKVNVMCVVANHGKASDFYVEVKDKSSALSRNEVANIWSDYSGIVEKGRSSSLILVTRAGLTPSATAFVDQQDRMLHRTIWELGDAALGLLPYAKDLIKVFDEDDLSSYYIPALAQSVSYDRQQRRTPEQTYINLFDAVQSWILEEDTPPIAILGGYGAGKSSFAKRII